jgi:hypothetical protein
VETIFWVLPLPLIGWVNQASTAGQEFSLNFILEIYC